MKYTEQDIKEAYAQGAKTAMAYNIEYLQSLDDGYVKPRRTTAIQDLKRINTRFDLECETNAYVKWKKPYPYALVALALVLGAVSIALNVLT